MINPSAPVQKQTQSELQITIVAVCDGIVWQREIFMPAKSTVQEALLASEYLSHFPKLNFMDIVFGIYGKRVSRTQFLVDHDRIEIYAPLQVEPKVARRRRAAHREKIKNIKKKMPINDLTQS